MTGDDPSPGGDTRAGGTGADRRSGPRPLERADLEAVARLRMDVFDRTQHDTTSALRDYLEWLFFESPWADSRVPSLVSCSPEGELLGFLGVLGHDVRFGQRTLLTAVSTQLMVTEAAGPLTAIRLLRTYLGGEQDLSWSDQASADVRRLWEKAGGDVLERSSQRWVRALRPYRRLTGKLGSGPIARAGRLLVRPVCSVLDAAWLRWGRDAFGIDPPGTRRPFSVGEAVECHERLVRRGELWPAFGPEELEVILAELERSDAGDGRGIAGSIVDGGDGEGPAGWYLYRPNPGGESRVLALVARPDGARRVLRHLFAEAHRRGVVAVSGRVAPVHAAALADVGCLWARRGPWLLAHSTDPEVGEALQQEASHLTRVDGEGWLRF